MAVGQVPDLPLRMQQIALDERARLAPQQVARGHLQHGPFGGRKFKCSVAQRGVILFKDVDDAETSALVVRNRKAHGIRDAGGRKVLAQAAGIAAIA